VGGEGKLMDKFLRLYEISPSKGRTVSELGVWVSNEN